MNKNEIYLLIEPEMQEVVGGDYITKEVGWIVYKGEVIKTVFLYNWDTGEITLLTGQKLQSGHTTVEVYS